MIGDQLPRKIHKRSSDTKGGNEEYLDDFGLYYNTF